MNNTQLTTQERALAFLRLEEAAQLIGDDCKTTVLTVHARGVCVTSRHPETGAHHSHVTDWHVLSRLELNPLPKGIRYGRNRVGLPCLRTQTDETGPLPPMFGWHGQEIGEGSDQW